MKKVTILFFLFLAFAIVMMGAGKYTPDTLAQGGIKNVKVALVNEFTLGQWQAQYISGVLSMFNQVGIPQSNIFITDAKFDRAKMISDLRTAIAKNVDIIIINHGAAEGLKPIIQEAINKGIVVVTVDLALGMDKVIETNQDDYLLAYYSLMKLIQDFGGKANIGVVWVGGFTPMEKRRKILDLLLGEFPGIKVVANYGRATQNTVGDTMEQTLAVLKAHPEIDAFWASWDQFAQGVYNALKQTGKKIPIYSIDISPEDISMMREKGSPWVATAAADPYELGRIDVRLALIDLAGQKVPRFYLHPAVLITQDMVRKLPEGEYLSKKYVSAWGESGKFWPDWLKKLAKVK